MKKIKISLMLIIYWCCLISLKAQFSTLTFLPQEIKSRNINTSLPVGTLKGNFEVSATGAATYTVPIDIPPGTNGVQPAVSIVYSSQSGDGKLGYGWNIGGLSAITRVNNNFYLDSNKKEIQLDSTDRFALDGKRLMLLNGTYGNHGTQYGYQLEDFTRIYSYGQTGKSPDYFLVKTPDGKTITYGGGTATIKAKGAPVPHMWRISRITDAFGNYIEYQYGNTNGFAADGESYLDQIVYTGNAAMKLTPYNRIKFTYAPRNNAGKQFLKGYEVEDFLILTKIQCFAENQLAKSYQFDYFKDYYTDNQIDYRIHLNKITEISNNKELNYTLVNWGEREAAAGTSVNVFQTGKEDFSKIVTGDFNGDGLTDYLNLSYNTASRTWLNYKNAVLFLAKENNAFDKIPLSLGFKVASAYVIDIDNDGDEDFFTLSENGGNTLLNCYSFHPVLKNCISNINYPSVSIAGTPSSHQLMGGDFDGDNKNDLFVYTYNNNGGINGVRYLYQATINITKLVNDELQNKFPTFMGNYDDKAFVADFNGNGVTEILLLGKNFKTGLRYQAAIEYLNGKINMIFSGSQITNSIPLILDGENQEIFPMDFTADGKTDLLVYHTIQKDWKLLTSFGNGFMLRNIASGQLPPYKTKSGIRIASNTSNNNYSNVSLSYAYGCKGDENIHFGDFNRDGKIDIVFIEPFVGTTESKILFHQYFNTGLNFEYVGIKGVNSIDHKKDKCTQIPEIKTGDFNGDASTDLLLSFHESTKVHTMYFKEYGNEMMVNGITDGYNNKIDILYKTLSHKSASDKIYTKTYSIYPKPLFIFQAPMYVVSDVKNPDGISGKSVTSYLYKNLVIHSMGKGVLGFEEMRTIYPDGKIERHVWEWDTIFYTYIKKTANSFLNYPRSIDSMSNIVLSKMVEQNQIVQLGNQRAIVLPTKKITIDSMLGIEKVNEYNYQPAGINTPKTDFLLKSELEKVNDLLSASGGVNVKNTEFLYAAVGGFPRAMANKISETNSNNSSLINFKREKIFTFDASTGAILTCTEDPGNAMEVKKTYEYSGFGTLIKSITQGKSIATRSTLLEYDDKNRFILKETDIERSPVPILNEYDIKTGALLKTTDRQGLYEQTTYDDFKRKVQQVSPLKNVEKIQYDWSVDQPAKGILYKITTRADNENVSMHYFDALGREVRTEIEDFNGTVVKTNEYDALGRIKRSSDPYLLNETPFYHSYEYDAMGRIIQDREDCGQEIIYDYSLPRKITIRDVHGRTKSKTIDALKRESIVEDNGGLISYGYNTQLKMESITSGGLTTSFKYDIHGNRIALNDPNAGVLNTEYNEADQIVEHTDSKGNHTRYIYDFLNRLSQKIISHKATGKREKITYTYQDDIQRNGFGLVSVESSDQGTSMEYLYDQYNRIITKSEIIKGRLFQTNFRYDSKGNLKVVSYPNGFEIENVYDVFGNFYQVKNFKTGSVLYTLKKKDAYDRERIAVLGNTSNGGITVPVFDPSNITGSCGLVSKIEYSACNQQMDISIEQPLKVMGMPPMAMGAPRKLWHYSYNIEKTTGNILSREDAIKGLKEQFTYDALDRLTQVLDAKGVPVLSMDYADNGNILTKSDIGEYRYKWFSRNTKEHAVKYIKSYCEEFNRFACKDEQNIVYNGYNQPISIMQGEYQMNLLYGTDEQRNYHELYTYTGKIVGVNEIESSTVPHPTPTSNNVHPLTGTGKLIKEKFYAEGYEKIIDHVKSTEFDYNYVSGPFGIFGVNITNQTTKAEQFYFIQKDHLGSVMALIDECGNIHNEYAYDVWGNRRNPYTWNPDFIKSKPSNVDPITGWWEEPLNNNGGETESPPMEFPDFCEPDYGFLIDRGYTGQEQYDYFNLVNLNARLYDPEIGRMLSPDNFVGAPDQTQNYNRYTYAFNNPMKYTDVDGNYPVLIAAAIGAGLSAFSYAMEVGFSSNWTFKSWDWGSFFLNVGIGALSGTSSFGIGQITHGITNTVQATLLSAYAHGFAQGTFSTLTGGDFITSFLTATLTSGAGSGLDQLLKGAPVGKVAKMVGVTALTAGALEQIQGGNFFKGLAKGAIIGLLNHSGQKLVEPTEYMEFTGINDKGQRVVGDLKWYKKYSIYGKFREIGSWKAISGSTKYLPIPKGGYSLSLLRTRYDEAMTMKEDGLSIGYSLNVNPEKIHHRSQLRVHPDGGAYGTAGCIGILEKNALFLYQITEYFNKYFYIYLNVSYNSPTPLLYPK